MCACVCVCFQVTPLVTPLGTGKDAAEDIERKSASDQDAEEQELGNEHTAAVDNEADVAFWANWDPRRAPKGDVLLGRMSKGNFLFSSC